MPNIERNTRRFHIPWMVIESLQDFVKDVEVPKSRQSRAGRPAKVSFKTEVAETVLNDYLRLLDGKKSFLVGSHECDEGKLRFGLYSPMASIQLRLLPETLKVLSKQAKTRKVTGSKIISAALMTFLSAQRGFNDLFCDKCNRSIYGNTYLYSVIGREILDERGRPIKLKWNTCNLSRDKIKTGDPILQNDDVAYLLIPDDHANTVIHQYGIEGKVFKKKALVNPISDSLALKLEKAISIKKPDTKALADLKYNIVEVLGKGLVKKDDGKYIATMSEPLFFV